MSKPEGFNKLSECACKGVFAFDHLLVALASRSARPVEDEYRGQTRKTRQVGKAIKEGAKLRIFPGLCMLVDDNCLACNEPHTVENEVSKHAEHMSSHVY